MLPQKARMTASQSALEATAGVRFHFSGGRAETRRKERAQEIRALQPAEGKAPAVAENHFSGGAVR